MQQEHLTRCIVCSSKEIKVLDQVSNLWGCSNCGLVFNNPRPTTKEIIKYYSMPRKYDTWLDDEKPRELMWKKRVNKLRKYLEKGDNLLDVSTGTGQFLNALKALPIEVTGTEVSQSAVEVAKEKYGLNIYKGTLEEIHFGGTTFDVISMFHVLEHVPNPAETVRLCFGLLKPNGILVIAVPNEVKSVKLLSKSLLKMLGIGKFKHAPMYFIPKIELDGSVDEIHLSHFSPKTLDFLLTTSGFKVLELSADPYTAYTGFKHYFERLYYACVSALNSVIRTNIYDATWVVARKVGK